jgi:hypothetical protein
MEINLIYENKVNGLVLPNCQPKEVFKFSEKWLNDNNSEDMGYLIKALFSEFGNGISVLWNGIGFQTLPENGFDPNTQITLNRFSLDDVLNDPIRFKKKKLLFVIEPFGHINFFKNDLQNIDKVLFENLKKINATILINYSHEGHLNEYFIEEILKNISYKKIIFLYNDYLNDYSKYSSKNVSFIRVNYYLNRSSRYFQHNLKENNIPELLNYSEKKYHFLSFNQYPHHHRVKIISELHKNNIIDNFLISYNPKFYETLGNVKYDYENQLRDLGYIDDYNLFISLPEKRVDFETNFRISGYGFEDTEPYRKSVISLISDTIFFKNQGFISEKVFKPIMYLQPFLIAGPPRYLKEIRNMGFKTFNGFIDESYDEELDDKIRLDKIINEIKRLCSIPINDLISQLNQIEDVLIYNQMKLLSFDFQESECTSVKKILSEAYDPEHNKNLL